MVWAILFHPAFDQEYEELSESVQDALVEAALLLKDIGPMLGRPQVDTLSGSRYANMKELRFKVDGGVWRVAFAFDPVRRAIILVAGNKSGVAQGRFYKLLVAKADKRFDEHLEALKGSANGTHT